MACLYELQIENVSPGDRVGFEIDDVDYRGRPIKKLMWGIKLEVKEGFPYNVATAEGGKLIALPNGTTVMSGYGWGHR